MSRGQHYDESFDHVRKSCFFFGENFEVNFGRVAADSVTRSPGLCDATSQGTPSVSPKYAMPYKISPVQRNITDWLL